MINLIERNQVHRYVQLSNRSRVFVASPDRRILRKVEAPAETCFSNFETWIGDVGRLRLPPKHRDFKCFGGRFRQEPQPPFLLVNGYHFSNITN